MIKWAWTILVVLMIGFVIYLLIYYEFGVAAGFALGMAAILFGLAQVQFWFYGCKRRVKKHLGGIPKTPGIMSMKIHEYEIVDYHRTLDSITEDKKRNRFAVYLAYGGTLKSAIETDTNVETIQWEMIPSGKNETYACGHKIVFLAKIDDIPFVAFLGASAPMDEFYSKENQAIELQLYAADESSVKLVIEKLRRRCREDSIYLGNVISLKRSDDHRRQFEVHFADNFDIEKDQIVLPQETMKVVERNVFSYLGSRETLKSLGHRTRHGVLFHGPPGTGKTMVLKHMVSNSQGFTVIQIAGRDISLVRETFQFGRLLSPSIIVFEDIDLIATDRKENPNSVSLHELLDEMDGLGADSDCVVIFTTNRPESLESALANRPGRVDQSIFFPLPDEESRQRLIKLYSREVDISSVDIEKFIRKTKGASASFIAELVRRAILFAIEESSQVDPKADVSLKQEWVLTDVHFDNAIREMVVFGGELNKQILGFGSSELNSDG